MLKPSVWFRQFVDPSYGDFDHRHILIALVGIIYNLLVINNVFSTNNLGLQLDLGYNGAWRGFAFATLLVLSQIGLAVVMVLKHMSEVLDWYMHTVAARLIWFVLLWTGALMPFSFGLLHCLTAYGDDAFIVGTLWLIGLPFSAAFASLALVRYLKEMHIEL